MTDKTTKVALQQTSLDLNTSLDNIMTNNPMILRIGIAGPRALNEHELSTGLLLLSKVLATIAIELTSLVINRLVTTQSGQSAQFSLPILRLTSSLAIGADRLAMASELRACLKDKATLEYAAVLPFLLLDCEQGMYEETRSAAENRQDWLVLNKLVQEIKVQQELRLTELAGDITSADTRDKAHFLCTQSLVANIDVLIVFTKESASQVPSHHLAGTNTTLRLALEAALPIIQIVLDAQEAEIQLHLSPEPGLTTRSEEFSPASVRPLLTALGLLAEKIN